MLAQAHVYIIGDVIGVGFRAWTKIQAKVVGVHGWVRNEQYKSDIFGAGGGVEALFQGEEAKVERMVELVEQGSPIAIVQEVKVFWQDPKEILETFEIRK